MAQHDQWRRRKRWAEVRRAVLDRDGWRCQSCGRSTRLDAHHLRPVADGGDRYDPSNCVAMCTPCHNAEHQARYQQGYESSRQRREWVRRLKAM